VHGVAGSPRCGVSCCGVSVSCCWVLWVPGPHLSTSTGNGTASLNVTVAGSIILHHFGVWAGYTERPRDDTEEAKFAVDALPDPRTRTRTREELALRAARAKLKQGSRLDQGQLDSDAGEAAQAASSLFHADSSSSSDGEDAA